MGGKKKNHTTETAAKLPVLSVLPTLLRVNIFFSPYFLRNMTVIFPPGFMEAIYI